MYTLKSARAISVISLQSPAVSVPLIPKSFPVGADESSEPKQPEKGVLRRMNTSRITVGTRGRMAHRPWGAI